MQSSSDQQERYYEIDGVKDKRVNQITGSLQYLVKWKGYKKPTWEPQENLSKVPDVIYDFEEKYKQIEQKRNKKSIKSLKILKPSQKQPTGQKTINQNVSYSLSAELNEGPQEVRQDIEIVQISDKKYENNETSKKLMRPRTKLTQSQPSETDEQKGQNQHREGNIYIDQVKSVVQIKKMNEKWMVEVEFQSGRLEKAWQQRDRIRLLYPLQLLNLYEEMRRARGIKST